MTTNRLTTIDAARGTAMFFVFISHFGHNYLERVGRPIGELWVDIGMVASPMFMLISGMMLGFLYAQHSAAKFSTLRQRFFKRALLLLGIGHTLISLIFHSEAYLFMTDTVAFCLVIGPFIVMRAKATQRILLSISLITLTWFAVFLWTPTPAALLALKEILFGTRSVDMYPLRYTFPLVPWLGVYLLGTLLGAQLAKSNPLTHQFTLMLSKVAALALSLSAVIFVLYRLAKSLQPDPHAVPWFYPLGTPLQKLPPGPAYLCLFGAIALGIIALIIRFERHRLMQLWMRVAIPLGTSSFFVFVFQYYVYDLFFRFDFMRYSPWWPAYFTASVGVIFAVTQGWALLKYRWPTFARF